MSSKSKKRAYDSDEEEPSTKRGKREVNTEAQKDDDGNVYWELSSTRRVGISEFKGATMVNLREFYQKDGKALPGKKGISLPLEQFGLLLSILPQVESTLVERGESVPRPDQAARPTNADEDGDGGGGTSRAKAKKRGNHELTSEEED